MKPKRRSRVPPVEYESTAGSWYFRLRRGKVAHTKALKRAGVLVVVDYDAKDRELGIEIIT